MNRKNLKLSLTLIACLFISIHSVSATGEKPPPPPLAPAVVVPSGIFNHALSNNSCMLVSLAEINQCEIYEQELLHKLLGGSTTEDYINIPFYTCHQKLYPKSNASLDLTQDLDILTDTRFLKSFKKSIKELNPKMSKRIVEPRQTTCDIARDNPVLNSIRLPNLLTGVYSYLEEALYKKIELQLSQLDTLSNFAPIEGIEVLCMNIRFKSLRIKCESMVDTWLNSKRCKLEDETKSSKKNILLYETRVALSNYYDALVANSCKTDNPVNFEHAKKTLIKKYKPLYNTLPWLPSLFENTKESVCNQDSKTKRDNQFKDDYRLILLIKPSIQEVMNSIEESREHYNCINTRTCKKNASETLSYLKDSFKESFHPTLPPPQPTEVKDKKHGTLHRFSKCLIKEATEKGSSNLQEENESTILTPHSAKNITNDSCYQENQGNYNTLRDSRFHKKKNICFTNYDPRHLAAKIKYSKCQIDKGYSSTDNLKLSIKDKIREISSDDFYSDKLNLNDLPEFEAPTISQPATLTATKEADDKEADDKKADDKKADDNKTFSLKVFKVKVDAKKVDETEVVSTDNGNDSDSDSDDDDDEEENLPVSVTYKAKLFKGAEVATIKPQFEGAKFLWKCLKYDTSEGAKRWLQSCDKDEKKTGAVEKFYYPEEGSYKVKVSLVKGGKDLVPSKTITISAYNFNEEEYLPPIFIEQPSPPLEMSPGLINTLMNYYNFSTPGF